MVSEFGKFTRKLRINRGKLLKDMAKDLNVTSSYLSCMESGRRRVPADFKDKICQVYDLSNSERKELIKAIEHSRSSIKLVLEDFSPEYRDVVFSFSKKFNKLSNEDKKAIRKILEKVSD